MNIMNLPPTTLEGIFPQYGRKIHSTSVQQLVTVHTMFCFETGEVINNIDAIDKKKNCLLRASEAIKEKIYQYRNGRQNSSTQHAMQEYKVFCLYCILLNC